jgi:hypothetical protein
VTKIELDFIYTKYGICRAQRSDMDNVGRGIRKASAELIRLKGQSVPNLKLIDIVQSEVNLLLTISPWPQAVMEWTA